MAKLICPYSKKEYVIPDKPEITIGRSKECDISLEKPKVSIDMGLDDLLSSLFLGISRRHAKISRTNGSYTLEDLGATNGTFLERVPQEKARIQDKTPLQDRDIIHLGQYKLILALN